VQAGLLADRLAEHVGRLWGSWGGAGYYRSIGYSRWEGLWGPFDLPDQGLRQIEDWMPDYRRKSWSGALGDLGVSDDGLVSELIEAHHRERRARQAPYADTVPALRQLSGRYALAIVTNGSSAVQRSKIAVAGIERYFKSVVVSGEVGAAKPDARPFLAALKALGARPDEAVMVGDSLERDVAGAQAAGIRAVWVNRAGAVSEGVRPDATITSLSHLPRTLERLARGAATR
jgi:putative hydrolase of the HAD superfamily